MVGIGSASGRGLWLNCGRPWIRALHLGTRRRVLPVGQSRVQAEDAEPPALRRLLLVGLSLVQVEDAALPLRLDVAEAGALRQLDAAGGVVEQADSVVTAPFELLL